MPVEEYYDCQDQGFEEVRALEMLESNDIELNAMDPSQYESVDITVDSGAGAPVSKPKHFPGVSVVDSPD